MKSEQIKEITEKATQQLVASLNAGRSEALTDYLRTIARFHRYSLHNVLLIALQKPSASYVAGFRTWNYPRALREKRGERNPDSCSHRSPQGSRRTRTFHGSRLPPSRDFAPRTFSISARPMVRISRASGPYKEIPANIAKDFSRLRRPAESQSSIRPRSLRHEALPQADASGCCPGKCPPKSFRH